MRASLLRLTPRFSACRAAFSSTPSNPMPRTVYLGGGNGAGYFAAELDACGAADVLQGLTIVTDEQVWAW